MIPKRIFQIWLSNEPMSEFHQQCVKKWQEVLPDYEIVKIGLKDIDSISSYVKHSIEAGLFIHTTAYIRAELLYKYGGIYLDLDVEPVKDFGNLLNEKCFVGWEDITVVNNAVMGCEKGHWLMETTMKRLERLTGTEPKNTAAQTGPGLITKILEQEGLIHDGQTQYVKDIKVLEPKYLYPYHYTEKFTPECVTDKTVTIHYWTHTWK